MASSLQRLAKTIWGRFNHLPLIARVGVGSSAAMIVGGLLAYKCSTRVYRVVYFWKAALPGFIQYTLNAKRVKAGKYKTEEEVRESWDKLHEHWAPKAYKMITTLKGIYLKMGQIYGSRSDMTPPQFQRLLSKLMDQAPSLEWAVMKPHIEKHMNIEDVGDYFAHINTQCIASASIGQVHRATLQPHQATEGFSEVVLKVTYPNSEALVGTDLRSMTFFSSLTQPEMASMMKEVSKQVMLEFDFRREAAIQTQVAKNLAEDFPSVIIPRVVPHLVSRSTLVMEYIDAVPLHQALKSMTVDEKREVITTILEAHGKCMLVDGLFHSDPHGGNAMIVKETPYRVCLLDFGQASQLDDASRLNIVRVMELLCEEETQQTNDALNMCMREAGFKTKNGSSKTLPFMARVSFDSVPNPALLIQWNDIMKADPLSRVPSGFVMATRCGIILRGLVALAGLTDVSTAQVWKQFIKRARSVRHDHERSVA